MMKLSLDTKAVRLLIKDQPAKINLTRAVVANVIKGMLPKDTVELAKLVTPELMAEALERAEMKQIFEKQLKSHMESFMTPESYAWRSNKSVLSNTVQTKIAQAVREAAQQVMKSLIDEKVDELIGQMSATIDQRMRRMLDDHFERDVKAEVQRRLTAAAG